MPRLIGWLHEQRARSLLTEFVLVYLLPLAGAGPVIWFGPDDPEVRGGALVSLVVGFIVSTIAGFWMVASGREPWLSLSLFWELAILVGLSLGLAALFYFELDFAWWAALVVLLTLPPLGALEHLTRPTNQQRRERAQARRSRSGRRVEHL